MKNNKTIKRFLSFILSLSMIMSMVNLIPMKALADSYVKSNVNMVYLGTGNTPSTTVINDLPNLSELEVGTKIWIGTQFSNLGNLDKNTSTMPTGFGSFIKKTGTETNANSGLYCVKTGYNYLSDYLKPVAESDEAGDGDLSSSDNIATDVDDKLYDAFWHNENYGSQVSYGNVQNENNEPSTLGNGYTAQSIDINITASKTVNMAMRDEIPDTFMLSIICFEITQKIPEGVTMIELALGKNQFTFETGKDGGRWKAQWNTDTSTTPNENLKNYFDYTGTLVLNPATFTVSFYKDKDTADTSGTAIKEIKVTEGKTIADMSKTSDIPGAADFKAYAPEGKFFEGLYYQKDGTTETKFDENVKIDADTKVYAKYTEGYTIAVHPQYPSDAKIGTTSINSTDYPDLSLTVDPATTTTLTADDEPTIDKDTAVKTTVKNPDGYYFGGWYSDAQCTTEVKFDDTTLAMATNKNIYAKWTKAWTVKVVKIEGDTDSENTPLSTEEIEPNADGKTYAKPSAINTDPTRDGYKFKGWYYKDNGTKTTFVFDGADNATKIKGDTTIYADWTKVHTVKYFETETDATNGDNVKATDSVENGDKVDAGMVPVTTDTEQKYFLGWYYKDGGNEKQFNTANDTVTSDLNLYQKWGDCYKIEFFKEQDDTTAYATKYLNPNNFNNANDIKLAKADFPADPTKEGWGFDEWQYNNATFDENVVVSGNMKVYAKWTEKITVSLYPNDGTGNDFLGTAQTFTIVPNNDIITDTSVTYAEPTRENYKFKEWNTEANGTGTSYTTATVKTEKFSASTKLYAIWEVDSNKVSADQQVTLTFDAVGGKLNNPTSITVKKGDSIYPQQLPADPTKKKDGANQDYDFLGWFKAATLTNTDKVIDKKADQTAAIKMDESKTVYAHWEYNGTDKVTITFDDNGATTKVSPAAVTIAPGDVIGKAMPADPELTNKAFDGWYIQTADTDKVDADTTTFSVDTTVKAHWIDEITVKYNLNGGDSAAIADQKGFPTAAYANPANDPTKSGYKFMGWNTAANGSGTFITNDTHTTYSAVSKAAQGDAASAPTEVTLYAYWAKVPSSTAPGLPGDTTPEDGGVKVTFDSNASGHKDATVVDANPKQVYVAKGDTIGTLMPNAPTSTHYKFVEWNTMPDGSGVNVTDSVAIGDNLGDALKAIAGTNTAYEVTLYAQWDIGDDVQAENKVTVTFNNNENLKGDASNTTKVVTIFKGDSLGYEPANPTHGTYNFEGWYDTYNAVLSSTNPTGKFDKDAPVTDNVTYYAQWVKYIKLEFATVDSVKQGNAEYTGSIIVPKWDVYETDKDGDKKAGETNILTNEVLSADFTLTAQASNSATDIKDVGEYQLTVATTTAGQEKGYKIVGYDNLFKVTQAKLTVKVTPSTQTGKVDTTNGLAPATIEVVNAKGTVLGVGVAYDVVYNQWTDANNDNKIAADELGADMKNPAQADFKAVAKYVVKVVPTSNYVVDSVVSAEENKDVLQYGVTAGYATFVTAPTLKGQDIVFEVQANDPSINALTIKSDGADTTLSAALDLKDNTFANTVTFDNAETPTVSEYWVRVSDVKADTGKFEFTVTNDTTKVDSVTVNGTALTADKITQNGKTVTFDAALTKTGQDLNDVVIVTKAGTDNNAPSITYTFHIQRLVEAKIELNYGNSPYGEIMKDSAITDKATAKATFDSSHKLASLSSLTYYDETWNSYKAFAANNQLDYNGDKDDTAIFVYQRKAFRDPGVALYDQTGVAIQDSDIYVDDATTPNAKYEFTAELTMKSFAGGLATYNDVTDNVQDIKETGNSTNYLFTAFKDDNIRPDVYVLNYKLVDKATNSVLAESKRFVIAISKLGDVRIDANDIVNNLDASTVKSKSTAIMSANSMYAFRMADAKCDDNKIINNLDASAIKSKSLNLPQFYNELPSN